MQPLLVWEHSCCAWLPDGWNRPDKQLWRPKFSSRPFTAKFPLKSFDSVFRVWSHQLMSQWKWASEQPVATKSGLCELQFNRALHGYALWWSLNVRTIWKFGSNVSWFVQGIWVWSSLAETSKILNICWPRMRSPSVRDDVFATSYVSVQSSSDIGLLTLSTLTDWMYMAHRDPLGIQICWLQRLEPGSSIMVGYCRLQHRSFPCVASSKCEVTLSTLWWWCLLNEFACGIL